MSADGPGWTNQAAETWKLTLPIDRATADRVAEGVAEIDALDPPPVLVVTEPNPALPDRWRLDAYFEGTPDPAALAAVRMLVGAGDGEPERIEDRDWVILSQGSMAPIRAGRFFVHTAAHGHAVPPDATAFRIEAGRAFGTGHHETTAGCLELLDALAADGRRFERIADVGTGTGLLAFAAGSLWPAARVIASDIDPVAVDVARANMAANGIAEGAIALAVADGLDAPALAQAAPFDLVLANILAGPLIALAPAIARALRPGGIVLLAGLLAAQAKDVLAAYRAAGLAPHRRLDKGDWAILALVQRA